MTPLRITSELSSTLSRSLLSFANFSGVSLLRIPRTFLKMRSFLLSGVSASRLTVEGGIQRCSVDRERISSLEGIEFFLISVLRVDAQHEGGLLGCKKKLLVYDSYSRGNFLDPDLPPETREAPPGPMGLSVVARVSAP